MNNLNLPSVKGKRNNASVSCISSLLNAYWHWVQFIDENIICELVILRTDIFFDILDDIQQQWGAVQKNKEIKKK